MQRVRMDQMAVRIRVCVVTVALCFGALHAGADVNIDENTKLTGDVDYRGQGTVTIAAGVTLDLCGHKLFVDGLSGTGTVTDSTTPPGENLITDGSFENVVVTGNSGAWGYLDGTAASSEKWHTDTLKNAGFTKANTPWANDVKGSVSAFIQITANLWQTVTVAEAGDYALTYSYKSRKGYISHEMNVVVDAQVCGTTSSAADCTGVSDSPSLSGRPGSGDLIYTRF